MKSSHSSARTSWRMSCLLSLRRTILAVPQHIPYVALKVNELEETFLGGYATPDPVHFK
jgi:hypothetical protein